MGGAVSEHDPLEFEKPAGTHQANEQLPSVLSWTWRSLPPQFEVEYEQVSWGAEQDAPIGCPQEQMLQAAWAGP